MLWDTWVTVQQYILALKYFTENIWMTWRGICTRTEDVCLLVVTWPLLQDGEPLADGDLRQWLSLWSDLHHLCLDHISTHGMMMMMMMMMIIVMVVLSFIIFSVYGSKYSLCPRNRKHFNYFFSHGANHWSLNINT